MEGGKESFGEAGADVADGFVGVGSGVVAGEDEDGGAFAFAVVGAEDDEVEGVAYAGEVVFLDLERSQ